MVRLLQFFTAGYHLASAMMNISVRTGEKQVLLSEQEVLFLHLFINLGLVIMDEEQEHTYKSERTPRYHAKQVANFGCKYNKALLLLTSATPSVESYTAALNGRYKLCELTGKVRRCQASAGNNG